MFTGSITVLNITVNTVIINTVTVKKATATVMATEAAMAAVTEATAATNLQAAAQVKKHLKIILDFFREILSVYLPVLFKAVKLMVLMDIHSHILPAVDDGAQNLETSIKLLEMMKEQGITDVIATPHFYADTENMEDFKHNVGNAYAVLNDAVKDMNLPKVHLGSEVYYFDGIGKSEGIKQLTLGSSKYILLELQSRAIDKTVLENINGIIYGLGLIPVFAHIERYAEEKDFKNLFKYIDSNNAYAQVNSSSVLFSPYKHIVRKLMKSGRISFIATDTHSPEHRPPMMRAALDEVKRCFGNDYVNTLIKNTEYLYEQINKVSDNDKQYG